MGPVEPADPGGLSLFPKGRSRSCAPTPTRQGDPGWSAGRRSCAAIHRSSRSTTLGLLTTMILIPGFRFLPVRSHSFPMPATRSLCVRRSKWVAQTSSRWTTGPSFRSATASGMRDSRSSVVRVHRTPSALDGTADVVVASGNALWEATARARAPSLRVKSVPLAGTVLPWRGPTARAITWPRPRPIATAGDAGDGGRTGGPVGHAPRGGGK